MTLIIRDLRLSPYEEEALLTKLAAHRLGVSEADILSHSIIRRSLDARKKDDLSFLYAIAVDAREETAILKRARAGVEKQTKLRREQPKAGTDILRDRPVVIGAGPCGMFAALTLARRGYKPLVIERGKEVTARTAEVEHFFETGDLNEDCNVLFGEGGAGTFSDGKLTTRIKDARCADVLSDFVRFGADESVTYDAKPHVGTDALRSIVAAIRREIISLGGEYIFDTALVGFKRDDFGALCAVVARSGEKTFAIDTNACVLAVGHSARDVYYMLDKAGAVLLPKPFAIGARIEHPREMIDKAQLGRFAGNPRIGAAEYHLTSKSNERGVYTFCMCPGGVVVASASERCGVVTNGMSYSGRDMENSNAAVVVSIAPTDFGNDALSGIEFLRTIERRAFEAGGGNQCAPAQRVADFMQGRASAGFSGVRPSYRPGVVPSDIATCLPDFVTQGIKAALPHFGRMLKGFDSKDAVLTAPETRTSSCVRIKRGENGEAENIEGLYPAGEGAGYAGGIASSAVDGIRAAEKIIERFAAVSR